MNRAKNVLDIFQKKMQTKDIETAVKSKYVT
jgi:hypothetical protein